MFLLFTYYIIIKNSWAAIHNGKCTLELHKIFCTETSILIHFLNSQSLWPTDQPMTTARKSRTPPNPCQPLTLLPKKEGKKRPFASIFHPKNEGIFFCPSLSLPLSLFFLSLSSFSLSRPLLIRVWMSSQWASDWPIDISFFVLTSAGGKRRGD